LLHLLLVNSNVYGFLSNAMRNVATKRLRLRHDFHYLPWSKVIQRRAPASLITDRGIRKLRSAVKFKTGHPGHPRRFKPFLFHFLIISGRNIRAGDLLWSGGDLIMSLRMLMMTQPSRTMVIRRRHCGRVSFRQQHSVQRPRESNLCNTLDLCNCCFL
jgi:hypothetical protein